MKIFFYFIYLFILNKFNSLFFFVAKKLKDFTSIFFIMFHFNIRQSHLFYQKIVFIQSFGNFDFQPLTDCAKKNPTI